MTISPHEPADRSLMPELMLKWFDSNKRDLPWRKNKVPYKVWVSEIMLQQTQVKTVIPYFNKWIESFPSVESLANASEEDVLKHWKGLGYYSRATRMLKAAKYVVESHGGIFPDNKDEMLKIPGIGPYSAGAILSIAMSKQEPLVDGNVVRVMSRIFGILNRTDEKIHMKGCKDIDAYIWWLAKELVPESRPGDFNESLMELGSEVCTPKQPKCSDCPVESICQVRQFVKRRNNAKKNAFFTKSTTQTTLHGDKTTCELCDIEDLQILQFEDVPPPKKRPNQKLKENCVLCILNDKNEIFVEQRPKKGLLASLWQFPMVDYFESNEALTFVGELTHVFTHFKQRLCVYTTTDTSLVPKKGQFVPIDSLLSDESDHPLWTGMVKVLHMVRNKSFPLYGSPCKYALHGPIDCCRLQGKLWEGQSFIA